MASDVVATVPDPEKPDAILWACRGCLFRLTHDVQDDRKQAAEAEVRDRLAAAERAAARLAASHAVDGLPASIAAALHAKAANGGRLGAIRRDSPLYAIRLELVYAEWCREAQ